MNQLSINLAGNINAQSATDIANFIDAFANLYNQAVQHSVIRQGLNGAIEFLFISPFDFDFPADVSAVVEYDKNEADSLCREILTTNQKPILEAGDMVVALSVNSLESELNDYRTIDISEITTVANTKIWIGYAASSQGTTGYTPFSTAIGARYFSRTGTRNVQAKIVKHLDKLNKDFVKIANQK